MEIAQFAPAASLAVVIILALWTERGRQASERQIDAEARRNDFDRIAKLFSDLKDDVHTLRGELTGSSILHAERLRSLETVDIRHDKEIDKLRTAVGDLKSRCALIEQVAHIPYREPAKESA